MDYGNGSVISYTYDPAGNRLTYSAVVFSETTPPAITITGSAFMHHGCQQYIAQCYFIEVKIATLRAGRLTFRPVDRFAFCNMSAGNGKPSLFTSMLSG